MGTTVLSPQNYLPLYAHRHDWLLSDMMDFPSATLHRAERRAEQASSQNDDASILASPLPFVSPKRNLGLHTPSAPSRLLSSCSYSVDPVLQRPYRSQERRPFASVQENAATMANADLDGFLVARRKKLTGCDKVLSFGRKELSSGIRNGRVDLLTKKNGDTRKSSNKPLVVKVDTGISTNDTRTESESIQGTVPAVTVLRRPKTEEDALRLLAKYDWKTEGSPSQTPRSQGGRKVLMKSFSDIPKVDCSSIASSLTTDSLRSNEAAPLCQMPGYVSPDIGKIVMSNEIDLAGIIGSSYTPPKEHEPWAGPAYSNPPPPSSLPLPKFALKERSYSWRDSTCSCVSTDKLVERDDRRSASAPPATSGQAGVCQVDVALATKDLRRLLNLDC